MNNEYIVVTSVDYNSTHHQNKHYNFITTLQTPRVFEGDWEVGLVEIDFNAVHKPETFIKKFVFKCYQFEEVSDGVYSNWKESEVYTKKIKIEIPEGLEGMNKFEKHLHEKHPIMRKFISFKFGLMFHLMEIKPVKDSKRNSVWHVMVPDSNCSTWSELYDHNFKEQETIDWHIKVPFVKTDIQDPDYIYSPTYKIKSSPFTVNTHKSSHILSSHGVEVKGMVYNWYNLNNGIHKLRRDTTIATYGDVVTGVYPRTLQLYRTKYNHRDAADWFYIHCNLVEPTRIVGTSEKILRAIPFNTHNHNGSNYYMFSPIFYKKLNTEKVTSIEIQIIDSLGYFVSFTNRVRLVLHFRKLKDE